MMERTEPTLVPEWLKFTGNVVGGGTNVHHSDVLSSVRCEQSRSLKDRPRCLDRSSLASSRSISNSNGSAKHPYSSFIRRHRDKNRDIEKEKHILENIWEDERSSLKRSQSTVSRKPREAFPRRLENSKNGVSSQNSGNGVLSKAVNHGIIKKAAFEKDFPSLGTKDRPDVTGIRRFSSTGLGFAVQNLPTGNSGFLGIEKWTSALAEVPAILTNNGHPPLQQSIATNLTSNSRASNATGLNMAEALLQHPAPVTATFPLPDKIQMLEDLAVKQSRQLIPMTPSMPKPLVASSADKSKQTKITARTNEMTVASRGVKPQPNLSYISRHGQIKSDSSSTSHVGKFLVLKAGFENGATTATKDSFNPTGDANSKAANNQVATAPISTASMSPRYSKVSALEDKAASLSLSTKSVVDKRLALSLARSRREFFNLMRRKTSPSVTINTTETNLVVSSPDGEKCGETFKEVNVSESPRAMENDRKMICNGDGNEIPEKIKSFSDAGENNLSDNEEIYPDEEEVAFLRSLGWEENCGEDEGLTEEEINAFYQEYMNRIPSLKGCRGSQPECLMPSGFQKAI